MVSREVTPCSFVGTVWTESSEVSVSQPTRSHIPEVLSIYSRSPVPIRLQNNELGRKRYEETVT